ncbi:hypothetical protein Bbelb_008330 [Branchiostoma belcheri]|nr:hypothetical protein Bbelb_008330 [Branchiostoma belcheri]
MKESQWVWTSADEVRVRHHGRHQKHLEERPEGGNPRPASLKRRTPHAQRGSRIYVTIYVITSTTRHFRARYVISWTERVEQNAAAVWGQVGVTLRRPPAIRTSTKYPVYRGWGGFSSGLLKLFPARLSKVPRRNTPTGQSVELDGGKLLEPRRQPAKTTIDWAPGYLLISNTSETHRKLIGNTSSKPEAGS